MSDGNEVEGGVKIGSKKLGFVNETAIRKPDGKTVYQRLKVEELPGGQRVYTDLRTSDSSLLGTEATDNAPNFTDSSLPADVSAKSRLIE